MEADSKKTSAHAENIKITWVKGHAGQVDIDKGNSTIAHQNGNNNADTLANKGAQSIALPEPLFEAHLLRRRIVISLQAMFLACYTRRQKARELAAIETVLERQLEGEAPQGADQIAPIANPGLEQLFTPTQRVMTAHAATSIKNRFPQYAWENVELARAPLLDPNVRWPIANACFRKPQWKFPVSFIDPLIWYWTHLDFYSDPATVPAPLHRGVTWIELAADFEICTRVPLSKRGPDNAIETMRERASLMADASKALLRGFGVQLKLHIKRCTSLQAFRSTSRAGLRLRPALLRPEAVGLELGLQTMMHPHLMGTDTTQWKWRPSYRFLPIALYNPVFLSERLWRRNPTRLNSKTRFKPSDE